MIVYFIIFHLLLLYPSCEKLGGLYTKNLKLSSSLIMSFFLTGMCARAHVFVKRGWGKGRTHETDSKISVLKDLNSDVLENGLMKRRLTVLLSLKRTCNTIKYINEYDIIIRPWPYLLVHAIVRDDFEWFIQFTVQLI